MWLCGTNLYSKIIAHCIYKVSILNKQWLSVLPATPLLHNSSQPILSLELIPALIQRGKYGARNHSDLGTRVLR